MRPLSGDDLYTYAKLLSIPYFRGVYMRDALPKPPPWKNECAIVNLDNAVGPGSHWVSYRKRGNKVQYFDSFGNLRPPVELVQYFGPNVSDIQYNYMTKQPADTVICGHLCLDFLTSNVQ